MGMGKSCKHLTANLSVFELASSLFRDYERKMKTVKNIWVMEAISTTNLTMATL